MFSYALVSLALKLCETESAEIAWDDNLVVYSSMVVLNINTIQDLENGMKFGCLLQLPARHSFNCLPIHTFLFGSKKDVVRPLSHVT